MAKKVHRTKSSAKHFYKEDFSSWNFVIFLTLGFILLVVVLRAMSGVAFDLRSKAGLSCAVPTLPRPEDCSGGTWQYGRNKTTGCVTFVCQPTTSVKK